MRQRNKILLMLCAFVPLIVLQDFLHEVGHYLVGLHFGLVPDEFTLSFFGLNGISNSHVTYSFSDVATAISYHEALIWVKAGGFLALIVLPLWWRIYGKEAVLLVAGLQGAYSIVETTSWIGGYFAIVGWLIAGVWFIMMFGAYCYLIADNLKTVKKHR